MLYCSSCILPSRRTFFFFVFSLLYCCPFYRRKKIERKTRTFYLQKGFIFLTQIYIILIVTKKIKKLWVCLDSVLFEILFGIIIVALFVMWCMWDKKVVENIKKVGWKMYLSYKRNIIWDNLDIQTNPIYISLAS